MSQLWWWHIISVIAGDALDILADAQLLHLDKARQTASTRVSSSALPPDFTRRPVKKSTVIQRGGEVVLECRPHASPRATISWWREGGMHLKDSER